MPSRKQRRLQKKAATIRRFQRSRLKPATPLAIKPQPSLAVAEQSKAEPKILAEDIGKLSDFGIPEITISYMRRGGIHVIRGIPEMGRAGLLKKIKGVGEARLAPVERLLQTFGVTIPA